VVAGLVSSARARDVYGVVVTDGKVETADSQALRERLRGTRLHEDIFDLGPAREEWERLHGVAAERIAAWLPSLPAGVRRYAQVEIYRHLHMTGRGPYGPEAISTALAKVRAALGQPFDKLQEAAE
jgi:hypothetical protein